MKWSLPAKTFLLGEYAAVAEASALVLTTSPCFELSLIDHKGLSGIHPESPAGLWWQQQKYSDFGLIWHDPYEGCGGLGASSAQFLGSYLAACHLLDKTPDMRDMLENYYKVSWSGKGLRPSGYDVIAQSQQGCVYINKHHKIVQSYAWPFDDLSFFLIHTGVKLATHHHLQDTTLPESIDSLSALVDEAKLSFELSNSTQFLATINQYHQKLVELNRVADHSLRLINTLKEYPEVRAIKGCGALGADIILLMTSRTDSLMLHKSLTAQGLTVLATEKNLFIQSQLSQITSL